MLHGEWYYTGAGLVFLCSPITAQKDKRDEQEGRVNREVGRKTQGQHRIDSVSTNCICNGVKDTRRCKDTSGPAQTGHDSERIEEKPGTVS